MNELLLLEELADSKMCSPLLNITDPQETAGDASRFMWGGPRHEEFINGNVLFLFAEKTTSKYNRDIYLAYSATWLLV